MDNRRYQRVDVSGYSADISDGVGFYPGVISDISRAGVGMSDLPKRIDDTTRKMIVVVSGPGVNFKMLIRPKWSVEVGFQKIVGFEILNIPWAWTEFVMRFEEEPEEDVWEINL